MTTMKPYYKNNLSTLYNGDCVEIMEGLVNEGVKVDKVITSPPYNTMRSNQNDVGYDFYKDNKSNEEYIDWIINIFSLYDKMLNPNGCVCFNMSYGGENTVLMSLCIAEIIKKTNFILADILVWKKKTATPNNVSPNKMTRICEFVYIFARKSEFLTFKTNKKMISRSTSGQAIYENIYNFFEAENNNTSNSLNKATFSTDFVDEIIKRYVSKDDVVLDNFSGTGTTMKSCESKNIRSINIELSEAQCEYSVNRIKKGVQLELFDI